MAALTTAPNSSALSQTAVSQTAVSQTAQAQVAFVDHIDLSKATLPGLDVLHVAPHAVAPHAAAAHAAPAVHALPAAAAPTLAATAVDIAVSAGLIALCIAGVRRVFSYIYNGR